MNDNSVDISLSKAALIAGLGYLIIFILGIFANFFVLEDLIIPGDASGTFNNIIASEGQFRFGILCFTIMVIFDLVLAWALYILLRPVNRSISLLCAWFRLVNVTIFGIALYNLVSIKGILQFSGEASSMALLRTDQVQAQMMLFLNAFDHTWLIGLIFFGIHLFILGYLIIRSDYIPSILGVLLLIASLGYLADSFANLLMPDYANYESIFMLIVVVPGVIGEFSFTLWLLLRGSKLSGKEMIQTY